MGVFVHMAVSEQPIKLDARYLSCMQNYQWTQEQFKMDAQSKPVHINQH